MDQKDIVEELRRIQGRLSDWAVAEARIEKLISRIEGRDEVQAPAPVPRMKSSPATPGHTKKQALIQKATDMGLDVDDTFTMKEIEDAIAESEIEAMAATKRKRGRKRATA